MLKYFTLLPFSLLLIGCTKQIEAPKITIGNEKVFYTDIANAYHYQNDIACDSATNMVAISLTNTGNKKLVFAIDRENPRANFAWEKEHYGTLLVEIITPDGKNITATLPHGDPAKIQPEECNVLYNTYLKTLNKYKKFDVPMARVMDVYNLVNHEMVLLPGETKSFYLQVTLPLITESQPECGNSGHIYFDSIPPGSRFRVRYSCNATALKAALPAYLKQELNRNGYEIFNGEITSQTIPLVKR